MKTVMFCGCPVEKQVYINIIYGNKLAKDGSLAKFVKALV